MRMALLVQDSPKGITSVIPSNLTLPKKVLTFSILYSWVRTSDSKSSEIKDSRGDVQHANVYE